MSRTRYKVFTQENQPCFVTCTVVDWIPIFGNPNLAKIVLDSLEFLQDTNRLQLNGYVIMENHLHMIVSTEEVSKEMKAFKSFTARSIIDYLTNEKKDYFLNRLKFAKKSHKTDQTYQVWQEGFHPQMIQGREMFRQKLEYIHNNPVKRGYVSDPSYWRYSSYPNYLGEPGLIPVRLIDLN